MFGGQDGLRRIMSQENIKPRNVSETLARFGHYFKSYWLVLGLCVLLVIISTWAQVVGPELIGQAVDCYLSQPAAAALGAQNLERNSAGNCWYEADTTGLSSQQKLAGLGGLIWRIVGLYVVGSVLTGATFYLMAWVGQHVLRAMREDVFQHLHRLSLGYYAENEVGDLMSRITNDSETIGQAFNFALLNVFGGVLLIVWIAYNMLVKNAPYALVSLIVVPVMIVATLWFSDQARKAFRRTRAEMGSINAELQESISAVREVQAFNRAEESIENFRQTNAANRDANIRAVAFTSALSPTLEALGYLALVLVAGVGGWVLLHGETLFGTALSLGVVITFLTYVQRFNHPIQQISMLWANVQNAVASGERIFDLLDEIPQVQDKADARPMPPIRGKVELVNVSAAYKPDEPVLKKVNLTVEPGQTVAIVGPTGAGKTTIINLLPRFYDVTGGAVLIDGIDVRDVSAASLRQQIGVVLQDTFLFSDTVMENIRFGRPSASDEEVMAAARLARADEFIERLPEGYQTVLGERGSGLSQGQRQLLAIARTALANPRILILDEATSSVDTRTERLIQTALDELLHGRTSFVIAHRLSTIRNANQVLVLNQGEIIERDTHTELLARQGFYYNLYMSQFRQQEEPSAPNGRGLRPATAAL